MVTSVTSEGSVFNASSMNHAYKLLLSSNQNVTAQYLLPQTLDIIATSPRLAATKANIESSNLFLASVAFPQVIVEASSSDAAYMVYSVLEMNLTEISSFFPFPSFRNNRTKVFNALQSQLMVR
jgi:hypothetical protein